MKHLLNLSIFFFFISCNSDDTGMETDQIPQDLNKIPTPVIVSLIERDCGSILVSWTASSDEDINDIIKYKILINDEVEENIINDLEYLINSSSLIYPFEVSIIAFDGNGGESETSNLLEINELISADISFLDDNLKQAIIDNENIIDSNGDNEISECEAFLFDGALALSSKGINKLDDLVYFVNAIELDARGNNIDDTSMLTDLSFDKIYLDNNPFIQFNMGKNEKLKILSLRDNQLSTIDIANFPNLEGFDFTDNEITVIDVSNNLALKSIVISRNKLTQIDVSSNIELLVLFLNENDLFDIDVTNNKKLKDIVVARTLLSSLYVGENPELKYVICSETFIERLDFSNNPNLRQLNCGNNDELV